MTQSPARARPIASAYLDFARYYLDAREANSGPGPTRNSGSGR